MPPNNEPFHRVKQGMQSMQGHRPRMSGLDGGLCVPSDTETLREKKPALKRLKLETRYQFVVDSSDIFCSNVLLILWA